MAHSVQHFRDLASGLVRREAADQPEKAPSIAAGLAAARTGEDRHAARKATDRRHDG